MQLLLIALSLLLTSCHSSQSSQTTSSVNVEEVSGTLVSLGDRLRNLADELRVSLYEPDSIRFTASNDFFLGSHLIVVNKRGQMSVGVMPNTDMNHMFVGEVESVTIPSPGSLREGYEVWVRSRHGQWVSFAPQTRGHPDDGKKVTLHLYVQGECSNRYLWPELQVAWGREVVTPMGREVPEPHPDEPHCSL